MGLTVGIYLIEIILRIKTEIDILEISDGLNFNLGLTIGKYVIKIIFDIKIETGIFEISNVPNFNKF